MEEKIFSIYRSSAGSGKTRTLAKEYLLLALRFRADYFRHILAVTFTNKSTQEMKDRILDYLGRFASGIPDPLAGELMAELTLDPSTFQERCQDVLSSILHDYSHFSISTIDAFFQRVIRSFTREAELVGDYRLEVELDPVLDEVVNRLIDGLVQDKVLTRWIVEFANDNLESERAWDVRKSLVEFSKEIFRDEFRVVSPSVIQHASNRENLIRFQESLRSIRNGYLEFVHALAARVITTIREHQLTYADFKYANGGVYGWFVKVLNTHKISDLQTESLGARPHKEYQDASNWPSKTANSALVLQLAQRLSPAVSELVTYIQENGRAALSAQVALDNFYSFGLITDIITELKAYKQDHGVMLLAEAPEFLNGVIGTSDTPFIFEKVGSVYRHFLIDEFQDTSDMQWKNLRPLVENGLDQGFRSMVVGDVKQAIYRWRGGDLKLLQQDIEQQVGGHRVQHHQLGNNFRSSPSLIRFNNRLFKEASALVTNIVGASFVAESYEDVSQESAHEFPGCIRLEFVGDETRTWKWKELAIERVPQWLEQLQQAGVPLKDIAILVRRNDEGQEIVDHLMAYRNSAAAKPDCRYDVISNETLRLDGASSVNLLLSAMRYLLNPQDAVARAQLAYEHSRMHDSGKVLNEVFDVTNQTFFEAGLPLEFSEQKATLRKLPLYELSETIISIFSLGEQTGEVAYLQAFQDLVLDFYSHERNDLGAFLEWWDMHGEDESLAIPEEVDAVRIFTIHKSKGLQFNYVLIPFCSWSLDHEGFRSPNLWVNSSESPYDEIGYIPVKYSGSLKNSYFASDYEQERIRCYLDNLNILYVAFTRAVHGMFVAAPQGNDSGTVSSLLRAALSADLTLTQNWTETDVLWQEGELAPPARKSSSGTPATTLTRFNSYRWREKLVIRHASEGFFGSGKERSTEAMRRGVHLHTVLSRIEYRDNAESSIQAMIQEGLLSVDETEVVRSQLDVLFNDPLISSWFSSDWQVRTEVPVLLPGNTENRMDRLITQDGKAIVIDFKTGKPSSRDRTQVKEYMGILFQMGFSLVEGHLLYLDSFDVVTITQGKGKSSGRKNKQQLDLGF